jgi:hypothetical protein
LTPYYILVVHMFHSFYANHRAGGWFDDSLLEASKRSPAFLLSQYRPSFNIPIQSRVNSITLNNPGSSSVASA